MNEQQDCEDLGTALGDIPNVPSCEWRACVAASIASKVCGTVPVDYDLPNVDESAK